MLPIHKNTKLKKKKKLVIKPVELKIISDLNTVNPKTLKKIANIQNTKAIFKAINTPLK